MKIHSCRAQSDLRSFQELLVNIKTIIQMIFRYFFWRLTFYLIINKTINSVNNKNNFYMWLLFDFYLNFELCTKNIVCKCYYLTILNSLLISHLFFVELVICKQQSVGTSFDQNGWDVGIKHSLLFSKSNNFLSPFEYLVAQLW